jgi:hypothetical protein
VTTWHAEFVEDLAEVAGAVHDAWFDIDDLVHDVASQTLVIPFAQEWDWGRMREDAAWRDAPKPELTRATWRYREERVPFMRGALRIASVESVAIDERAGDAAMLLGIRYDVTTRAVTVEGVSGNVSAHVQDLDDDRSDASAPPAVSRQSGTIARLAGSPSGRRPVSRPVSRTSVLSQLA